MCDAGYAEVEYNGEAVCVPRGECSRYLKIAVPLRPGEHGNIGGGLSSGRVTSVFTGGTLGTGSQGAAVIHQGLVITGGVSVPSTGNGSTMVMAPTGAPQRIPPTAITTGVSSIPAIGIGTVATVATGIGARPPGFTLTGGSLSLTSSGVGASPGTIGVTGSPSAVGAPVTNVSGTVGIVATGAGGSLQGVPPISVNGGNTVRAVTTPAGRGTPQLGFPGGPQSATGGDAAAHRTGSGGGMPGPAVTVPVQSISGSGPEGVVQIPSSGVGTNAPIITNMNVAYGRAPYGDGSITGGTYNGATATGNTLVHGEDRSTGGISGSHSAHPGTINVSRPSFSTGTGTPTWRGTPGISVDRSGHAGAAGPAPKMENPGTVIETGSSGNILFSTSGINGGTVTFTENGESRRQSVSPALAGTAAQSSFTLPSTGGVPVGGSASAPSSGATVLGSPGMFIHDSGASQLPRATATTIAGGSSSGLSAGGLSVQGAGSTFTNTLGRPGFGIARSNSARTAVVAPTLSVSGPKPHTVGIEGSGTFIGGATLTSSGSIITSSTGIAGSGGVGNFSPAVSRVELDQGTPAI